MPGQGRQARASVSLTRINVGPLLFCLGAWTRYRQESDPEIAPPAVVGSQTGEFRGQPPTGRKVNVPGDTIFRFVDDKISEVGVACDPAQFVKSQD